MVCQSQMQFNGSDQIFDQLKNVRIQTVCPCLLISISQNKFNFIPSLTKSTRLVYWTINNYVSVQEDFLINIYQCLDNLNGKLLLGNNMESKVVFFFFQI